MKIALGMYTVYEEFKKKPLLTLKKIKASGYDFIEMYGDPFLNADEFNELLNKSGLSLIGWHVEWKLLQPDSLNKTMEYHKKIGNKRLIIPALGGPWEVGHKIHENSADIWRKYSMRINWLDNELGHNGLEIMYHTHDYDYGEVLDNGQTSLDILIENCQPSVYFEIDSGNCLEVGRKPEEYLKRLGGQSDYLHCKAYSLAEGYEVLLGSSGDVTSWENLLRCGKATGVDYLVIENESVTLGDKIIVAKQDYDNLKTILKNI